MVPSLQCCLGVSNAMALDAGSIEVDDDGVATGSGLALAIFNGAVGGLDAETQALIAAGMKSFCEGIATAIVDHIRDNAEVTITIQTSDSGLQRTPNPVLPDVDTQGPSIAKTLTGTVA